MADDLILDDVDALVAADPGLMLRAIASSGAQVREALSLIDTDALAQLDDQPRPRSVALCGMGGSGIAGSVVAALAARGSSVPAMALHDYLVPAWLGPVDVLVAVSCSGTTEETLTAAAEALRRGTRLVAIGTANSPLLELAASVNSSVILPVDARGRMPRASLWTLLVPALLASERLGLVSGIEPSLVQAADRLDEVALRCGVEVSLEVNEAKALGLALAESLPMVWGSGELGPIAAERLACQLNENAQVPVVVGSLPEAHHNQVVTLDSPDSEVDTSDIFRDRVNDPNPATSLRMVLVRDGAQTPEVTRRAELSEHLAALHGVPVSTVRAGDGPPVARLADLVGVIDWASTYAALSLGVDPSPIGPIDELKARLSARP